MTVALNSSPLLNLESVQLDRALGNTLLCEECGYFEPLVSLELDYLTEFIIVNKSAIASKFLTVCQTSRYATIKMTDKTFLKALRSFLGSYSIYTFSKSGWERRRTPLTLGQALQRCQRLTTISLLNANVNVILLRSNVIRVSKGVAFIRERV